MLCHVQDSSHTNIPTIHRIMSILNRLKKSINNSVWCIRNACINTYINIDSDINYIYGLFGYKVALLVRVNCWLTLYSHVGFKPVRFLSVTNKPVALSSSLVFQIFQLHVIFQKMCQVIQILLIYVHTFHLFVCYWISIY